MLKDSLTQIYLKVTILQLLLLAAVVAFAAAFEGSQACLSAIAGGAAVIAGSVVYMLLARQSAVTAKTGNRVFGKHAIAEAAKVAVVIALMFTAFASGWFDAAWLVVSMGVVLLGQLLAFLIIR